MIKRREQASWACAGHYVEDKIHVPMEMGSTPMHGTIFSWAFNSVGQSRWLITIWSAVQVRQGPPIFSGCHEAAEGLLQVPLKIRKGNFSSFYFPPRFFKG